MCKSQASACEPDSKFNSIWGQTRVHLCLTHLLLILALLDGTLSFGASCSKLSELKLKQTAINPASQHR
jgi:hypothetical protein